MSRLWGLSRLCSCCRSQMQIRTFWVWECIKWSKAQFVNTARHVDPSAVAFRWKTDAQPKNTKVWLLCVFVCVTEMQDMNSGAAQSRSSEVSWTEENSQNVSGGKWFSSSDFGGKITSPLRHQRGEDVQPEVGLRCQDRAEQWVLYHREGRDSGAEAGHETAGLNHDTKTLLPW